jgi:hypothetical protein
MQTLQCEVCCYVFELQHRSQFIKIIILFCAEAIEGKMSHVWLGWQHLLLLKALCDYQVSREHSGAKRDLRWLRKCCCRFMSCWM